MNLSPPPAYRHLAPCHSTLPSRPAAPLCLRHTQPPLALTMSWSWSAPLRSVARTALPRQKTSPPTERRKAPRRHLGNEALLNIRSFSKTCIRLVCPFPDVLDDAPGLFLLMSQELVDSDFGVPVVEEQTAERVVRVGVVVTDESREEGDFG